MGIKSTLMNLFNKKKVYRNKKVMVKDCDLDISINDEKLLVTLGQWMSVLPDSVKTGGNGCYIYSPLSVDDFLKRFEVSSEQEEEIRKRFAYMLTSVGMDDDDFGVIECFDEEELTFKGEFFKQDYSYDFQITWGSFMDQCPQLRVTDGDKNYRYDYIGATDERPDTLRLETYTNKADKDHTFYHYESEYRYIGRVYNDDYKVDFEVEYPQSLNNPDENPYIDEVLVESVLLCVKFPVDIQLLCKRLSEAFKCDASMFPTISIIVDKKEKDKKEYVVTDKVVLKNGEFHEFVITKNGKRIAVDKFDNWSVKNNSYRVAGNADNHVSYNINDVVMDDCKELCDIPALIESESHEAKEAKGIALTLMQKKKSN